jgi:hypothetical protein
MRKQQKYLLLFFIENFLKYKSVEFIFALIILQLKNFKF